MCPTFEFCECCDVEFGYQDCTPEAARRWREQWLAAGADWARPEFQPVDWSLERQLENVPAPFR